jgi:hypothetical protein
MSNYKMYFGFSTMTWAWLFLVGTTLLAWWFGFIDAQNIHLATTGVIIAGATKIWIIGHQFMELHRAPPVLYYSFVTWALGIAIVLLTILTIS